MCVREKQRERDGEIQKEREEERERNRKNEDDDDLCHIFIRGGTGRNLINVCWGGDFDTDKI